MSELLNLLGDCIETVYKLIDKDSTYLPVKQLEILVNGKTKPSDFTIVKTLAKGGFGEVFLVKSDRVYAMKRVAKTTILKQPNTALFMAEKQLLVESTNSGWLVSAKMTLQDDNYLYYCMDFIPGGDFWGFLNDKGEMAEDHIKFYASEIVAALDELHKLGWIHRDLKPDNILIDIDGHIKLADFGSSIKMIDGKARSSFVVGTPDYVSPDILECSTMENEYEECIDFWALGVIIYEMLYDATPFYSETLVETYKKITDVDYSFPYEVSEELTDLIKNLIKKKNERLKIKEIKNHRFFKNIDWDNIKKMTPPYIPKVSSECDTSNFMDTNFDLESKILSNTANYINFIGFSHDPKLEKFIQEAIHLNRNCKKEICMNIENDFSEEIKNRKKENLEKEINKLNNSIKEKIEIYKTLMTNTLAEREELEQIENLVEQKRKNLLNLENEINDKQSLLEEYLKAINLQEKSKSLKINFNCFKQFGKDDMKLSLLELKNNQQSCSENLNILHRTYKEIAILKNSMIEKYKKYCENLKEKKDFLEKENTKLKKSGIETLKKQIRVLTSEIKEYQQIIDQELSLRKRLENEIKLLKNKMVSAPNLKLSYEFIGKLIESGSKINVNIKIEEETFYINNKSCHIRNVFIQELKNNELYHETYKIRSLILKIIFIKESVRSISSTGRRSIKSLEDDLKTELSMKQGLETMIPLLEGKQLNDAKAQYNGSLKKIQQLTFELEAARKSTLTEDIPEDPIKLYEFNNHLFATKTFTPNTICEYCNEVLYGIKDQGFECRDCKMIVHKSCYILCDVSCEMYSAFKKGEVFYIILRSVEEKEKLLNLSKNF